MYSSMLVYATTTSPALLIAILCNTLLSFAIVSSILVLVDGDLLIFFVPATPFRQQRLAPLLVPKNKHNTQCQYTSLKTNGKQKQQTAN